MDDDSKKGKDSKEDSKAEKKGKDLATMPFSQLCSLLVCVLFCFMVLF